MNSSFRGSGYYSACELIYQNFRGGQLRVSPLLEKYFELDYAPEPYLYFPIDRPELVGRDCLHFLTTNPGLPLARQKRGSPLVEGSSYEEVARKLASNYLSTFGENPELRPALSRINKMLSIAKRAQFSGVLQVDVLPWHSDNLPSAIKRRLPQLIAECETTRGYLEQLKRYLADKPVVTIDGVGSGKAVNIDAFYSSWLELKASLIGLNVMQATFCAIVSKGEKVTGAALMENSNGIPKVMFGVQGNNNLPREDGMQRLASLMNLQS